MKIGYLMQVGVVDLFSHPPSGPALHVKHVIEELTALGHQVTLLIWWRGQNRRSDDLLQFAPVPTRWLDHGPLHLVERLIRRVQGDLQLPYAGLFDSVRFTNACAQTLADYDLFFERMGWMSYGGALAAKLLKKPLVLEVNGDHFHELQQLGLAPEGMNKWLATNITRWGVHQATHTVATGEGWRQRFIDRWQVNQNLVSVVENGSELVKLLDRSQLRSFAPATEDEELTLVYIGAFEPWHGLAILLNALAIVTDQGVACRLWLIGGGSEEPKLRQQVADLALTDRVTFTGYRPMAEVATYLAQADIGLCPYCGRVEYSGLKLLDYKAAGLVTIASGANGQPAVLAHGRTGWIVPPCDEAALAAAILALNADGEKRKQIGRQARFEAEACHSWRHTAQQLEQIFYQVVQKAS